MKERKKYRKTISKRTFWALTMMGIFIMLSCSVAIGIIYQRQNMDHYQTITNNYAKAAADYIDGETIHRYSSTKKKDEYYFKVLNYLNVLQRNTDIQWYYVFIPHQDKVEYIWDAITETGSCELGELEDYMENGKEASMKAFSKKPDSTVLISNDPTYGYIASCFYPIFNNQGKPVALVGVDMSMPNIWLQMLDFILAVVIIIILVIAIAEAIWYIYLKKALIIPIDLLNNAARSMVANLENDEQPQIDIHTDDEIEELSDSFKRMDVELKDYITKFKSLTAEKERIGAELDIARAIQTSMLPRIFPPFPERTEFDLYATMRAAKEVGGDFYDYYLLDDDHLAIVMADVSGKGIPAALFMMISKILINNFATMNQNMSPAEILHSLNHQICENNDAEMFVTVWLGILEISTGKITAANAGHEYPIIYRKGGEYQQLTDKHGLVIGAMDNMKYTDYEIQLNHGDKLFIYTDGLPEATNKDDEQFGMDRVLEALNKFKEDDCMYTLNNMYDSVKGFVKEAPQFDDLTMLSFEYK